MATRLKQPEVSRDDRVTLARAVHELKEQLGARRAAHVLYCQARTLTLEADRQAMADRDDNVTSSQHE